MTGAGTATSVVRLATRCSAALAVVVVIGSGLLGFAAIGALIALGLTVGVINGIVIERLMATWVPFMVTSMMRLVVLSAVVLGAVVVLGAGHVWPLVLGVGIAQLALAGSAVYVGSTVPA